jgi:hypothetical protein
LHEKWHFFSLLSWSGIVGSFLSKKLAVYQVIEWTLLLKKLLVVGEVNAREDPLEEVSSLVFLYCLLKTLFLFFWVRLWRLTSCQLFCILGEKSVVNRSFLILSRLHLTLLKLHYSSQRKKISHHISFYFLV